MAQTIFANVYGINGNNAPLVPTPMGFSPSRVKFRPAILGATLTTPVVFNGTRVYGIIEEYGAYNNNTQYYVLEDVAALVVKANT